MIRQQIFTRVEVVNVIEEMLQHADAVVDAITSEDPKHDPEDLLDMTEEAMTKSPVSNTGAKLIAIERQEQIEKHGFQIQHDENYIDDELVIAAEATIRGVASGFPESWRESPFIEKICAKNKKDRLVIAGALIAAEIDRIINYEIA